MASANISRISANSSARQRVARRRRSLVLALLAIVAVGMFAVAYGQTAKPAPRVVALRVAGQEVDRITVRDAAGDPLPANRVVRSIAPTLTVRARGVTTVRALDVPAVAAQLGRSRSSTVDIPSRVISTSIAAPVVAQRLRNNCETAALQVLLATTGVRVDQLALQGRLARSGPADPQGAPDAPVWGDPDQGYVGRADGTGPWGGFGVYPAPIARLAAAQGRRLRDASAQPASVLYASLSAGHAVMAWVGLGDGPYRAWTSPSGRSIRVNLNEHTIVLTGMRADGSLDVVNVLQGTRENWTRSRFEQAWALLGDRALTAT